MHTTRARRAGALLWALSSLLLLTTAACGEAEEATPSPTAQDMDSRQDMSVDLGPQCTTPDKPDVCGAQCTDLLSDPLHCGECGNSCGTRGVYCDEGSCGCLNNGTWCGPGQCLLTLNDSNHCGACNRKCPAGHYCQGGECVEGGEIAEVVKLTNEARASSRQCGDQQFGPAEPLQINDKLNLAAQGHSEDMAARGFFEHDNPDGVTASERMRAAGYRGRITGENIAMGQPTPRRVVDAWLDSPGHCKNIMNPSYREIGIGFFKTNNRGPWWTQNFGAP